MLNNKFRKLIDEIKKFRDERDWMQFHKPKDMAQAISIEAAELQELFLWKSDKEIEEYLKSRENLQEVKDEIADIFTYLVEFSDNLDIDVEKAVLEKIKKNAFKYPVIKSKGKSTKYNKLK